MRWTRWSTAPAVLLAAASLSVAQTGLELVDGRVLDGVTVERVDGGYELLLESGARIVIPQALVREVRLIAEPADTGVPEDQGREPTASESAEEIPPPDSRLEPALSRPYAPLAVFGPQRPVLARNAVDLSWRPSSDWRRDLVENEFDPSSWSNSAGDSRWIPEESFDKSDDWILSPPARWANPPIGTAWRPTGFEAPSEFD